MTTSIGNVLGGCEFSHGENGAPGDRALPTAEPQGNQSAKIPESRINGAAAMLQRAGFMRSDAQRLRIGSRDGWRVHHVLPPPRQGHAVRHDEPQLGGA